MSNLITRNCRAALSAVYLGGALAGSTWAEPAEDDPIGRYLQQHGLVEGSAPAARASLSGWQARATEMVLAALTYIDLPYRRGGTSTAAVSRVTFSRQAWACRCRAASTNKQVRRAS
jgi:hypothetical protein